jgi:hypothetical protein
MTKLFELGLTMAGAISAGAYTGGVVDFLIEALDAYCRAKSTAGWDGPGHDVTVPVISGASAGAITAAIAAIQVCSEIDHVRAAGADAPPERRNRLYDSWVRKIDIAQLLSTSDLGDGKVRSLLDSSSLLSIGRAALATELRPDRRPWVADPLAIFLTVANLRGVPYGFRLFGDRAQLYGMTNHMDDMRFLVGFADAARPGFVALKPQQAPGGAWPDLVLAAIASGAFPIGLQARTLRRDPRDYYDDWRLRDPAPVFSAAGASYEFLCVDGGLMNNEPLELARRYLAGGADRHNPREGDRAARAVVMIDPFPNVAAFDPLWVADDRLIRVAAQMFGALVSQARFKAEELALAENPDVYSRFVISPSRRMADDRPAQLDIAAGIMGGFGGFLHPSFRHHDFMLGRRNCQHFLRRHLALPETNPLFADLDEARRRRWCVKAGSGEPVTATDSQGRSVRLLPVVPLAPEVSNEIGEPPAPTRSAVDLAEIEEKFRARAGRLGAIFMDTDLRAIAPAWTLWLGKKLFLPRAVRRITAKAVGWIGEELDRLDGLRRPRP